MIQQSPSSTASPSGIFLVLSSGLNPNFDLPKPDNNSKGNPKWKDKKIQTLMLPEHLNKLWIPSIKNIILLRRQF